jgi:hypothetical protein
MEEGKKVDLVWKNKDKEGLVKKVRSYQLEVIS